MKIQMCLQLYQKKEAPYLGQVSDEQVFFARNEKARFQLGARWRGREVPLEIIDKILTIILSLSDQPFSAFAKPEKEAIYNQSFRRYVQKIDT